jgi:large repetitive protein
MKGLIFFGGNKMQIWLKIAMVIAALMIGFQAFPNSGVSFSIQKTGPAVASPGDLITYTISYSNTGTSLAHSVVIKDFLPSPDNFEYVSSTPEGVYNSLTNSITWSLSEIPGLALLGSGTNLIIVTLRAGKTGVPPVQSELGYYLTSNLIELENYASIQSEEFTVPVLSNTVTTVSTQNCTFSMSEPNSGIKSASNSTVTYIVAITNTGNIYQQYSLQTDLVSGQNLFQSIQTLSGQPLSITPFLAPGETYFFHYVLTTPNGTSPNSTTVTRITATPSICGTPVTSDFSTFIYGGNYNTYQLLSVYKIDNPDPVQSGNILTYQVVISNAGNDLANVRVIETYPDNTTFLSADPPPTTGNNIWDFTNLPPGNSFITITVQVENDLPNGTILTNKVTVGSFTTVTSTFTELTTVLSAPDLSIIKTATIENPPAEPGSLVYYTLSYQNNGNSTATNVVIRDNYNEQYMVIYDDGGGNTSVFGEISWTFATLAPGQGGTIHYTLKIIDDPGLFPAGTTNINNTATIINNLTDSNINDNISTATITVSNLPDLKAEKTATINPALVLQSLNYEILISNVGRIAHTGNYTVTDYLPNGTNYLSSNPAGLYNSDMHTVTWVITTDLVPNQSEEFSVSLANIDCELAGSNLVNRVTVISSNFSDADNSNNEFILLTPVIDNEAPVITLPQTELVLQCFDVGLVDAWIATASATDNCAGEIEISTSYSEPENNCDQSVTVTFSATDSNGNTTVETKAFYVNDTTAPVLAGVPADVTVECNAVPPPATTVTATDNCDTEVTITFSELITPGTCTDSYTITRTWTATDNCGNSITYIQTITVQDTSAPVWDQVMPGDVTVECDAIPEVPAVVTASDNCDTDVQIVFTEVRTDGVCPDTYTLTRTWTATDNCGNSITHVQVISVEDTTAPVWDQVMPADITVECDGVPEVPAVVTASDNCDTDVQIVFTEVRTDGVCPDTYTLTRTWTATDNCGNQIVYTQVITVEDTTAPVWDQLMPADVTVECDGVPEAPAVVTASDNCDSEVTVVFGEVRTDGSCPDTYTLTRTWTATDNCGNSITHVQVITVEDTTAPVWDQLMPVDITVECDGVPEAPAVVTASDNCDSDVTVVFGEVRTDGSCPDTYTLTRTWTATDNCGNSITHVQVISVEDTTAPVWDQVMPADITVECDGVPEVPAVVTASDNCDTDVQIVFTEVRTDGVCPDTYTLTRTWTATDNCGNQIVYTQVITVEDTTAPVWDQLMPADVTVECDGVPEAPAVVTASDNCDSEVTVVFGEVRTDGSCPDTYTLTRTWTATDNCGNSITHVQVITVEDTTAPVWDQLMPVDITVECDGVPEAPAVVTASDNCDSDVTVVFGEVRTDGSCPDTYTLTRTWTATDNCGNSITHVQVISVEDTTDPTWDQVMPADITVECDGVPEAPAVVTASDNCDSEVTVVFGEVRTDGSCPDTYTLTRTWTATDNCGNSITHIQLITVEDTTDPTWDQVMPADITVECDAVPAVPAVVTASDNCDSDVTVVFGEVRTDGSCPDTYTLTRTWTATDNCGNSITHVQVISVEDTTAPTWDQVMPADITVECDGVPEAPAVVTASDNCDSDVTVVFGEVRTDGSCPDTYTLTRTWTATDNCGNSITHVQVISIEDTTAPTWDQLMPADITVECDDVPEAPAVVTASDNCDSDVTVVFGEVRTDGSCPDTYTLTRTWIATDECGNTTEHTQTITVEDTTPPVFVEELPQDQTVECDEVSAAVTLTATDNCGEATVTFEEVRTDGTCPFSYILTRTWTATDECENETVHVQTITVQDTTPPVFVEALPADMTVECDEVPAAVTLTAIDNCGEATVTFEEVRTDGTCPFSYILTRTWTATDECENETVHVQTITVQDTTPPVFVEALPQDQTVECDEVPAAVTLTAIDNCGEATVTFEEVRTDGTCPFSYILTRTWTATDECENETVHVQTITVQDTTPPVFVEALPQDQTVECDEVPAAVTLTATDNCGEATVTFEEVRTDGTCPFSYILTRTWTATDECENETVHVQTITVQDTTPPVFVEALPQDQTVECDEVPAAVTLTATDNCGEATVTFEEVRTDGDCPFSYILTRTWTATDECENETVHVQTITVQDTTPPVFVEELPQDQTVECDEVSAAVTLTATDNCGTAIVTFEEVRTDGDCPFSYILTRTWTATDECENETVHVQTITVQDTTPPVFVEELPQDQTVECDEVPAAVTLTATDNCDTDVTVVYNEARTDGTCPDSYTLTRTWTATDNCGNQAVHVQVITVQDTTDPEFVEDLPQDLTVECNEVPQAVTLTATDNCDTDVTVVYNEARTDGTCPDSYTLTRTWTATDNCGNQIVYTQVITVEDTTAPVWDQLMPADVTVECDGVPAAPAVVTASDNCDSDVTVVFSEVRSDGSCPDTYTLTRTWTATDNCGNSITHVQVISIEDTTDPTWDQVMPADITVECDGVPEAPAVVTASDNCDSDVTVVFSEVRTDGSCPDTYTLTRTWTATDNCGNSITHVQVISIEDTTDPTWDQVMPADITVECDGLPEAPAVVTASDNCDSDVTVVFGEVRTDGSCPDTYTLTRTWTATDNCGNSITHVQVISVEDTTAPVWDQVMPADITVECDGVPEAPAVVTASDNCDTDVTVVFGEVRTDGSCPDTYTLTRTWTATDNCGNSITHVQVISIEDTTDPTWDQIMPTDITVECDGVPEAPAVVTASDNCDSDVTVVFSEVRSDGSCPDTYTLTRTWTATDNCGNSITHVQVISIEDTTDPTWDQIMPTDITVECDGVPEAPAVVTASDNCDSDVTVVFSEVRSDGSCPDTYTLTRTWTATDNCGNSITHVQVISVEDTTAPVWDQVMPADITVECDGVPEAPAVVTASDNCDSEVTVVFSEVRTDGSCPDTYTLTRTWTATDNCGNSITHVQVISVEDTTAPVWDQVMPADITVECDDVPAAPAVVTASDNCDSEVTVVFGEVRTDGSCPDTYTLTRTWTATDNCGNSITHVQVITVEDTTDPTWDQVMPADITVECDDVPEAPALVTASDNCDDDVEITYTEVRTDGDCPFSYILTRTWTATDECENETVHLQTITVQDTTPPVFVEALPQDQTVECDEVPAAVTLTATDNCGEATVTFEEVRTDGTCPFSYILTRTWTATDECENETVHVQTITVQDTTPPVFVEALPADMTVECDEVPAAVTLTAIDNCGEATVTFEEVRTDGTCPFSYILTRTWTATDECENETVHVQTITVQDTTPPVFVEELPQDQTVECDEVPAAVTLTAIDNCGEATVTFEEVRTDGTCPFSYILTRTWTATDECENETVHVQTITVQDTTPPVFVEEMPQDQTVECDEVPAAVTLTAIDNCGEATVTFEEVRTEGDCPFSYILTRTWTATDECENETVHLQTITVQDTTPPVFVEELPQDQTVECDEVPAAVTLTAIDNCGEATVTFEEVRTEGDCPFSYILTRTWTATDECENETVHLQTITVQDTTPPVFVEELPQDLTVECNEVPQAVTLTATDNCDTDVPVVFTEVRTDGTCPDSYTLTRTWTATDNCGNSIQHVQVITVQDTTDPTWDQTMPADDTVECDAIPEVPAVVTASDNCDSDVTVVFGEVRTDGSCPDTYTLTRTWTATDNCGNSITHVQVISIEDTTAPTWDQAMPADITVECDGVPEAPAVVTASDNCDSEVTVVFGEVRTDGVCPDTYTLTRTWTATDNCGN